MHSFRNSLGVSVGLHAMVVLLVVAVVSYHPVGVSLPEPDSAFAHAIAVTLAPLRKIHPPRPKQPPQPPKPVSQPHTVESQATEADIQTPPPDSKPAPPQPPPDNTQADQEQASYNQIVMAILEENKRYPREAMLAGTEGAVSVTFVVNSVGTVLGYDITQTSGSPILDDEIKRLLHSVRLPPFPPDDLTQRKTLSVTLDFNLHSQLTH
jgi:TonB family protein